MLSGLLLLFVLLCPAEGMAGRESLPAQAGDQALNKMEILTKAAAITIPFVKNVGQFDGEVTYAADLFAGRFFLTGKELVYTLHKPGEKRHIQPGKRGLGTDVKKAFSIGERFGVQGILYRSQRSQDRFQKYGGRPNRDGRFLFQGQ